MNQKEFDRNQALREISEDMIVTNEFQNFILGDLLGYGISRYVFDYKPDDKYVIKIDLSNYNANVIEFNVWKDVEYTKHAKWFAPIKHMSPCGRILLQEKCIIENIDKYPNELPEYMSDIKISNFGWLNGKFVCFDYAGTNLITKGLTSKLKKVKWLK